MQQLLANYAGKQAFSMQEQPSQQRRSTFILLSDVNRNIEVLQQEVINLQKKRGISPTRDEYIRGMVNQLSDTINTLEQCKVLIEQLPALDNIAFLRGREVERRENLQKFTDDREGARLASIIHARNSQPNLF